MFFFMIYCRKSFYNTEFTLLVQYNSTVTIKQAKWRGRKCRGGGAGSVKLPTRCRQVEALTEAGL